MSTVAKELRILAVQISQLTMMAHVASIAGPAVTALCDYLTLQARVMEMEDERDAWTVERKALRAKAAGRHDTPQREGHMTQQAKSAIQQLRQSVERLSQAQSNPQQLQQLVQEIQGQIQKLEQQLDD